MISASNTTAYDLVLCELVNRMSENVQNISWDRIAKQMNDVMQPRPDFEPKPPVTINPEACKTRYLEIKEKSTKDEKNEVTDYARKERIRELEDILARINSCITTVQKQIQKENEVAEASQYSWSEQVLNSMHFSTMRPIIEEQTHNTAVLVEQNAPLAEQPKIAEPAPEQNVDVTMNEPSKPVPIEKVISHEEPKPIIEKPAPIAPPVHVETARVASPTKDVAPAIEDFENHKVESPDMTDDINDEEYTPIKQTKKRTAPASSKDEDEPPHKMQKLTNDDDKSPLSKKGATSVKKQEYHDALQYAPKRTTRSQSRGGSSSPPPADVIPAHTADVVPPPTEDASPQAKNKKRSVKRTEGENDEQVVENDVTKEEPLESEVVPEHDTKTKRATKKTPNKKTPNKKTPKKTKKNVQSDSEREESEVEEEKIPLEDAPKANERALPDTKILDDVLKKILQEPEAHWFEKPVTDKEVLGYTKTIFNRTDLKTIKQLVTKREIVNIKGLRHQLLLMFTNAQMFNAPDTEVHLDTIELRKKCAQWIKEAEQEEETILGPTEPAAN